MEERLKTLLSSPNPGGQAGEVRTQIEPMKYTFILIYDAMTLYCELIVPQNRGLISKRSGLFEKWISRVSRRSRLSEGLSSTTFETIRGIIKSSSVKFRAEETELIALIFTPILNFALTGN